MNSKDYAQKRADNIEWARQQAELEFLWKQLDDEGRREWLRLARITLWYRPIGSIYVRLWRLWHKFCDAFYL